MDRKTYLFVAALLFLLTLLGGAALVLGLQSQLLAGQAPRGPLIFSLDTWGLLLGVAVAIAFLGAYVLRLPALLQPRVNERALSQYQERLSYQEDERRRSESMLRDVSQVLARAVPQDDFSVLVAEIAQATDADWVALARLQDDATNWRLTGVSVACEGIAVGLELPVQDSALTTVLSGSRCLVSEGATEAYADDLVIQRLGIEALDLLPLRNTEGRVVGALMLAFSSPRGQDEAAANVAQIFSRHCELLLARSAAEESLRVVLAQKDADVTGRTQELREAVEMLQRQVTERLKVERELRDERDSSHSNVAAKAAFLASMSHEIRTPMNGLLGMLTLLRHSALQRDQSEYLARAMESGDTLLRVVNDILDLSKIEAGRMSLELESLDLCDLLEGCAQSAAPAAAAKGVEVAVEYADAPAFELMGDSVRLRQLINNFVVNAIKYTDTGNITLAVKVENESAHEVTLHLAVRDTGCGIPANQAARVFEKYTQCEQDNEFGAMGTGLGLAINREIARLMGAEIGVESVPGVGSEFWLRLTLAKADTDCEWASGEMVGQICGAPVLLVMPESPLRRQAEEIFTRWDMPTTATDSLAKALAWCREQTRLPQNALLLLESGMPETEVTALLQRLRAMQGGERIAVLELTAPNQIAQLASPETAHQCVAIFTPIRRTDLLVAITTLFGKQTQTLVASQQTDTDYDFGAVSVLVVEDNPINMQVAVGYLRKLGIEPTQATDGQQAVELSQQHTFDLILMDCYMPRMDGYQASAQIRVQERDSDRHVPIVAMTANALAGDREHCRRAGMDGYLAKPISFNQMARELRHHLVDSETGASEGTLDYAAVRTLREIMGKGFPALVGEFIFDGEQQLRGMYDCYRNHKLEELACRAESLRDACLSVGATGLVPLLGAFTTGGRSAPNGTEMLLLTIEEHFAEVKMALSQTIGRHATLSSRVLN